MNKNNTFIGKLLAMVMIIGMIVTLYMTGEAMYKDYQIKKINEKYAYMESEEYKTIQTVMNEKYSR